MEILEKGWLSMALGFAAIFLGLNVGKDLAYYGMSKVSGSTTTTAAAA